MGIIKVVNVKCIGCASTIKKELEKLGIKNIEVSFGNEDSVMERTISFQGDYDIVKNKLNSLGYPEVGSFEAKSFLKKANSYVSCAIGKINL